MTEVPRFTPSFLSGYGCKSDSVSTNPTQPYDERLRKRLEKRMTTPEERPELTEVEIHESLKEAYNEHGRLTTAMTTPTPEERREVLIDAMEKAPFAALAHDLLIAYYSEREPALADAIRFGLVEDFNGASSIETSTGPARIFAIDYPEGHPKR